MGINTPTPKDGSNGSPPENKPLPTMEEIEKRMDELRKRSEEMKKGNDDILKELETDAAKRKEVEDARKEAKKQQGATDAVLGNAPAEETPVQTEPGTPEQNEADETPAQRVAPDVLLTYAVHQMEAMLSSDALWESFVSMGDMQKKRTEVLAADAKAHPENTGLQRTHQIAQQNLQEFESLRVKFPTRIENPTDEQKKQAGNMLFALQKLNTVLNGYDGLKGDPQDVFSYMPQFLELAKKLEKSSGKEASEQERKEVSDLLAKNQETKKRFESFQAQNPKTNGEKAMITFIRDAGESVSKRIADISKREGNEKTTESNAALLFQAKLLESLMNQYDLYMALKDKHPEFGDMAGFPVGTGESFEDMLVAATQRAAESNAKPTTKPAEPTVIAQNTPGAKTPEPPAAGMPAKPSSPDPDLEAIRNEPKKPAVQAQSPALDSGIAAVPKQNTDTSTPIAKLDTPNIPARPPRFDTPPLERRDVDTPIAQTPPRPTLPRRESTDRPPQVTIPDTVTLPPQVAQNDLTPKGAVAQPAPTQNPTVAAVPKPADIAAQKPTAQPEKPPVATAKPTDVPAQKPAEQVAAAVPKSPEPVRPTAEKPVATAIEKPVQKPVAASPESRDTFSTLNGSIDVAGKDIYIAYYWPDGSRAFNFFRLGSTPDTVSVNMPGRFSAVRTANGWSVRPAPGLRGTFLLRVDGVNQWTYLDRNQNAQGNARNIQPQRAYQAPQPQQQRSAYGQPSAYPQYTNNYVREPRFPRLRRFFSRFRRG